MFIPSIVLAECVHLIETCRIKLDYNVFSKFEEANNFAVVPLDLEVIRMLPGIKLSELHDKIIVATAKLLSAVLIIKDREMAGSKLVKTIWN